MGVIEQIIRPFLTTLSSRSTPFLLLTSTISLVTLSILVNVVSQLLHRTLHRHPSSPPLVFHWLPILGSTITYGLDPYGFFESCRARYGDVFTFILLGRKTTVYLGSRGNEFILNGKLRDVNAEEVYGVLCTPVFGRDVVYDCPNAKLMEQKKFMKIGLSTEAFRSYVPIIQGEVEMFLKRSPAFKGSSGSVNICPTMAEITIYTASHSLQGKDVRDNFDSSFASLYHDLDMGFSPINFMLHWAPLPHNRARDHAQRTVAKQYMEIIRKRRGEEKGGRLDILGQLMEATYKNGTPVPDMEIAHMMIALLMAGQHSSSSTSAWIMIRLASRPDITEELYQEQKDVLGEDLPPLTYEDLGRLPLHQAVLKETLRLHTPIHSIMRKVKTPMPIQGTDFIIPTSHVLLSSPGVNSRDARFFPDPLLWDPHRWDADSGRVIGTNHTNGAADEDEEKEDYGYGLISKGASSPYLPFGAGRHRCIGEQFAGVQLVTIMATMVRAMRVRNPEGWKEGVPVVETDYSSLFSRPLTPAVLMWERRDV